LKSHRGNKTRAEQKPDHCVRPHLGARAGRARRYYFGKLRVPVFGSIAGREDVGGQGGAQWKGHKGRRVGGAAGRGPARRPEGGNLLSKAPRATLPRGRGNPVLGGGKQNKTRQTGALGQGLTPGSGGGPGGPWNGLKAAGGARGGNGRGRGRVAFDFVPHGLTTHFAEDGGGPRQFWVSGGGGDPQGVGIPRNTWAGLVEDIVGPPRSRGGMAGFGPGPS